VRARRLAYAMMASRRGEVEAAPWVYRRAFADVFEELIASASRPASFHRRTRARRQRA